MPEPAHDLLLKIAGNDSVQLEPSQEALLEELIEGGLVYRIENPRQESLEARYTSLQEIHQLFLEAKACIDRLHRRLAPKSRLAGFFPLGGASKPMPDDPDVARVFEILQLLGIQIREVEEPDQVAEKIDRIKDRLQVDGRDCLDRLASTDREIDALQKSTPPGTLINAGSHVALTEAGLRALPEAQVMEDLESAFHAVAGPRKHKINEFSHFRDDPANLLAFVMECQALGEKASSVVAEFEALSEAFERLVPYSEITSMRIKNAFLIRLIRAYRETPKRPYLWCSRDRFHGFLAQTQTLIPSAVMSSGWYLPYGADLFIANPGPDDPSEQETERTQLYEAIQTTLASHFQEFRIGDGQFVRLALALMHSARTRRLSPSILLDKFVNGAMEAASEGATAAPRDLGDRGAKLIFGFHLAHAVGFVKDRIPAWTARFGEIEKAFAQAGRDGRVPAHVLLHALVALARLDQIGCPLASQAYADTYFRIKRKLKHHKGIARAFGTEHAIAEDSAFLAANLTAQVAFRNEPDDPYAKWTPDVGLAGLYEPQGKIATPLLGLPFGTLMMS